MGVALVTPFMKDGSVDYEAQGRLVDYQIESGTDFLCVLGTTAETPTLSADEQLKVRQAVIARNAGRLPILLGVGGNCTQAIVDKLKNDPMEGVDAILSVVPYYNKPTQRGMYAHFSAIAEATELPIILYNVPGRTGVNMLADTTLRLANDHANVVGIKEASGNVEQIKDIMARRPEGFKVFSGDDGITLPLIADGADGVISVIGNGFAAEFAQMVRLALGGEMEQAKAIDDVVVHIDDAILAILLGYCDAVLESVKVVVLYRDLLVALFVDVAIEVAFGGVFTHHAQAIFAERPEGVVPVEALHLLQGVGVDDDPLAYREEHGKPAITAY